MPTDGEIELIDDVVGLPAFTARRLDWNVRISANKNKLTDRARRPVVSQWRVTGWILKWDT